MDTTPTMAGQTQSLIDTLKRSLKAHGKTYADVARTLDLSEASIKRLLSSQQLSLGRLEQICHMMGMEIGDLVHQLEEQSGRIQQLTREQELEISRDLTLLLITVCVLNRWTLSEILGAYAIDPHTCIQKLAHLDRLKIIDLLPKNQIKLKVASNFGWIDNGPIQQFFHQTVANEFFNTRFREEGEQLLVLNGMLSKGSNQSFQRKMQRLAREFEELNREDAALDFSQRKGATVVLAIRGWNYDLFRPLLKSRQPE